MFSFQTLTPTLTIVQQRIIAGVLAALLASAAAWQASGDAGSYPVQKILQTPQPDTVDALDLSSAEAAWSELTIDAHGDLRIDAMTEPALAETIALLDEFPSQPVTSRIAFLLEKQFGASTSQQILALLPKLQRYKQAEQRWWETHADDESPPHEQLFRMQDELLGAELAQAMFAEQRRVWSLMMETHRIRSDPNLTPEEQEAALLELQQRARLEDGAGE